MARARWAREMSAGAPELAGGDVAVAVRAARVELGGGAAQLAGGARGVAVGGQRAAGSKVGRKVGSLRAMVTCSKAYAIAISVGSLQRAPKNETPSGRTPYANPAGTVMFG